MPTSTPPPMTRRSRSVEAHPRLPIMLTCEEVAGQLQMSERHVRRLVTAGALPVHRFGSAVRISSDDLTRYIAGARHG
jgi:excisionase family DNA binding protein